MVEPTDTVLWFPPLINDVPVQSIEVVHAASGCCHKLDDPHCNCEKNDMASVDSTAKSLQESPALTQFWVRYDAYDWSNLASSNKKLAAAITTFVGAAKDVINFPDCQDVRRLLVPLFVTRHLKPTMIQDLLLGL